MPDYATAATSEAAICGFRHDEWDGPYVMRKICAAPAGHSDGLFAYDHGPWQDLPRNGTTDRTAAPDDDYAQATGHEITCTAPDGLRDRLATWARHNALTDLEDATVIDQLAHLVEAEIGRAQDAAAAINGMRAKAERRAERAEARIQALTEATILWRDRPGGDIGLAIALSSILDTDKPEPPAATAVIRALRECDRIEAAVHANPQHPDFDGAYLACIGHIRTALNPPAEEATP